VMGMLTLAQIRENNKSNTSILYCKNENTPFSQDLINKCKEEFETFVKPIRDRVKLDISIKTL